MSYLWNIRPCVFGVAFLVAVLVSTSPASAQRLIDTGVITVNASGSPNTIGGIGNIDSLLQIPIPESLAYFDIEFSSFTVNPDLGLPNQHTLELRYFDPFATGDLHFTQPFIGMTQSVFGGKFFNHMLGLTNLGHPRGRPQIYSTIGWNSGGGSAISKTTFTVRAFGLLPEIDLSFVTGPLMDEGSGILVPFDTNNDGTTDQGDQMIAAVALAHSQHFEYLLTVRNNGSAGSLTGLAVASAVQDGFELDGMGEEDADGCSDGTCDGVALSGACLATLSGPPVKKGEPDLRYIAVDADSLGQNQACLIRIFVRTVASSIKGKGKSRSIIYHPAEFVALDTLDAAVTDTVLLTQGGRIFEETDDEFLGDIKGIWLPATQCP